MEAPKIGIDLNRLFPFYILIDKDLQIVSTGRSLQKIYPVPAQSSFGDFFIVRRPKIVLNGFSDIAELVDHLVILETKTLNGFTLRGQFDFVVDEDSYVFVGTPWIGSMDQIRELNLTLHDFALHDPVVDLLHVLKAQEIATTEIKQLLNTVNEQKNKVKQSEANYRSIVEKATDVIYKVTVDGFFTFVNPMAERLTGYLKEELLHMNFVQVIRHDYKEKVVAYYRHQVDTKTPTSYFEFPIITKNGNEKWVGQSVQYPQNDNTSLELTALAIDLTEKKYAERSLVLQEEKYRNIIANMNLGLLEVDTHDVIQYANQSFCNISGYSMEELIGHTASDLLVEGKGKEIISHKNNSRKDGVSDVYSVPVKHKNGQMRWWVISAAPRYNDRGDLVGSVGIHLDITEQKKLEDQLKIAKQKAEESSKAKESILATMSHEIRTPLNAIVGLTDLMQINPKTRTKENLDILHFSAKNLLALITDILDLSKIDAGKIELANDPFELKPVLNGVFQTFRPACEEKHLELILKIDDHVPEMILGDELRLTQILNNLLSNAVKFTPKGYVKIRVGASEIGPDKVLLNFIITDSGIGIKKNKLHTIFEAFEQADQSIVRQFGGTGLGLSITKKLIALQGGHIHVDSKINQGSTFSFSIMYQLSKQKRQHQDNVKQADSNFVVTPIDKTILIVEDNVVNQKVAVSYLEHWGLKHEIANNGQEALDMMALKRYDLALVDLFMPVMDGFVAIKKMRSDKALKHIPIIALTASAEINLMEKAIAQGADKCLTKPFNPQQLHDTIFALFSLKPAQHMGAKTTTRTKKELHPALVNLKRIQEASLGSKAFVGDMLKILSNEIPDLIAEADALFYRCEYVSFSKVIHKLKNNLLMLGIDLLKEDLQFMEEHAKRKERIDEIHSTLERLKITWSKAQIELEKLCKEFA